VEEYAKKELHKEAQRSRVAGCAHPRDAKCLISHFNHNTVKVSHRDKVNHEEFLYLVVPVHRNLDHEGVEAWKGREPLFQNPINLGALSITTFPVGDDVLVYKNNVVVALDDVSRVDLSIATGVNCLAIQCVEAKLPAMVVPVGKASNIVRADPSCGSDAATVNVMW
jgi:hypothetical protein